MDFGQNSFLALWEDFEFLFKFSILLLITLFAAQHFHKRPLLHFLPISLMLAFMLLYWLVIWSTQPIWVSFCFVNFIPTAEMDLNFP